MTPSRDQLMAAIDDLLRGIFGRYVKRGHKPHDMELTLGQVHCLRLIGRLDTPSMSELSSELELQPSTVTGLVDALAERGYVERREDPEDRRLVRVALTAKGRDQRQRHRRAMRRRWMDLLGDLEDGDLARIHEALSLLHAAAVRRTEQADAGAGGPERNSDDTD